jgi:ATP diphosphatase
LVRAAKLGKRAGRVGFDWESAAQVREKVLEELGEVDAASAGGATNSPAVVEEIGDLLFAVTNWSRHLKIDAEEALRAANSKFERRFRDMESLARERGLSLETLSPQQWENLWQESKALERQKSQLTHNT